MNQLREKIDYVLQRRLEVSDIDQHLSLGNAYVQTKQFDKAAEAFKAALAINENSPRTLLAIGKLYEGQGNEAQARRMFERAVEISPAFLKGHEALATLYLVLGDKGKHLEHLAQAVKISPRNLERKLMLGQSLLEAGQVGVAKSILKEVLEEASNHYAGIAERVGEALLAMGAYDVAERAFSRALDANPVNLHLVNQLGMAYRRQGKFAEAIANYQRATTLAPHDENLWYNLARAHAESGNKDQSVRSLKMALEINPGFEEAKNLLDLVTGRKV
jgi:tetratricopeptide (TPR) repeat protein